MNVLSTVKDHLRVKHTFRFLLGSSVAPAAELEENGCYAEETMSYSEQRLAFYSVGHPVWFCAIQKHSVQLCVFGPFYCTAGSKASDERKNSARKDKVYCRSQ